MERLQATKDNIEYHASRDSELSKEGMDETEMENQLNEFQSEILSFEDLIKEVTSQNAELRAKKEDLEKENQRQNFEIRKLEMELKQPHAQIKKFDAIWHQVTAARYGLKEQLERLQAAKDNLEYHASQQSSDVSKAENTIEVADADGNVKQELDE